MSKKNIQWLYQELPELVSKGILLPQNAQKLRDYYNKMKPRNRWWIALIICSALGTLLISLGIILLLSHNWEKLSRYVRSILAIAPLLMSQLLVGWVIYQGKNSPAWREGAAIFLTIMVGASIALIGQTYHIPGDMTNFLLTWVFLAAPLIYLMSVTVPAIIYIGGITLWAAYMDHDSFKVFLFWPMAAFTVPHFLQIMKNEQYSIRSTMLSWAFTLSLCVAVGITLGKFLPNFWIVIYSCLFAILYLSGCFWFDRVTALSQRPFYVIGAIGIFALSFLLTFRWIWAGIISSYFYYFRRFQNAVIITDAALTLLLLTTAISLLVTCVRRRHLDKLLFGGMPIVTVIGYMLCRRGVSLLYPTLLFNIYVFAMGLSRLVIGIQNKNLGVINAGMLMLAAIIIARFFDSDMEFVARGIAFIIIGIGFLATNAVIIHRKGGRE